MPTTNRSIDLEDAIKNDASEMWEQLLSCYEGYMTPDRWVDANNGQGGLITDCEGLMTLLLLHRRFQGQIHGSKSTVGMRMARCLVGTLVRMTGEDGELRDDLFSDGTPYIDPTDPACKGLDGPFTESVYMVGNILYYLYSTFDKESWNALLREVATEGKVPLAEARQKGLVHDKIKRFYQTKTLNTIYEDFAYKGGEGGEDRLPGWGFESAKHARDVRLYFTYNAMAFASLLMDDDELKLRFLDACETIEEGSFKICDWLDQHFLSKPDEVFDIISEGGQERNSENERQLYNNAYILAALTLVGFRDKEVPNQEVGEKRRLYLEKLWRAVQFLTKRLNTRWADYALSGTMEDQNQFVFYLAGEEIPADTPMADRPTYDDRTIVPLTLICLSRLGKMYLDEGMVPPEELEESLLLYYKRLLESRCRRPEFCKLWDKNADPSVYYTMRAVDAITEVYDLARRLKDEQGRSLVLSFEEEVAVATAVASSAAVPAFDYDRFAEALSTALEGIQVRAVTFTDEERQQLIEGIKAEVAGQVAPAVAEQVLEWAKGSEEGRELLLERVEGLFDDRVRILRNQIVGRQIVLESWLDYVFESVYASKTQPDKIKQFSAWVREALLAFDSEEELTDARRSSIIDRFRNELAEHRHPETWLTLGKPESDG